MSSQLTPQLKAQLTALGPFTSLQRVLAFELHYQIRQPLFWLVGGAFFLLAFIAMASTSLTVGGGTSNLNLNASFAIIQTHYVLAMIGMFVAVAFTNAAACRDYQYQTAELLMATPVSPRGWLLGRFLGAYLAALLAVGAAVVGTLLATFMPWLDQERIGAFSPGPYWHSLWFVIAPTLFVQCVFYFCASAMTRTAAGGYLAVVALLSFFITINAVTDQESLSDMAPWDPFGLTGFAETTRYWTAFEKNEQVPAIAGTSLASRLIWMVIALATLALTTAWFRFSVIPGALIRRRRSGRDRAGLATEHEPADETQGLPPQLAAVTTAPSIRHQLWAQTRLELGGVFKSAPFYIVLAFGVLNTLGALLGSIDQMFGTPVLPGTGLMVRIIGGAFSLMLMIVVVYYAAELVHRERQAQVAGIIDATPTPNGVFVVAKIAAMLLVILAMLVVAMLTAVGVQIGNAHYEFEFGVYAVGLLVAVGASFFLMLPLAVMIQAIIPGKYVGMGAVALVVIGLMTLSSLGIEHPLLTYSIPNVPYSDMNGWGHFLAPALWLFAYWSCAAALMVVITHLAWPRGELAGWRARLVLAKQRCTPSLMAVAGAFALGFTVIGGFLFYNTNVLNEYANSDHVEEARVAYEKKYGAEFEYRQLPEPIDVELVVDLYPASRRVAIAGTIIIQNTAADPVARMLVSPAHHLELTDLTIPGATLTDDDRDLAARIYTFEPALAPGETRRVQWRADWHQPGYQHDGGNVKVVSNGTFFDITDIAPLIGYDSGRELVDNNKRREHDLPPAERLPPRGGDGVNQTNAFGGSARTAFRGTVSTVVGQTAVMPGYLARQWEQDGRAYFRYEMDVPIWPFLSVLSASYAVVKDQWTSPEGKEVAIEVYHHAGHDDNVASMIQGTKDSLDYFTSAFSPYLYRQFRIFEFPGYRRFAQSFPNTIPFSEAIGFVADLRDPADIDYVYYVTAHELAHQWWGHTVIPALSQGQTMIVESLSQYSALMVMKKRFGRDQMRRFLKYELDRYLTSRGGELIEELPLALVENQQYIHYNKGSVVFFALQDLIGEDQLNAALRNFIARYGMRSAPFPETTDLLREIKAVADARHHPNIDDLFERITVYDLRTEDATVTALDGGGYQVDLAIQASKFYADGEGRETEAPLAQWLDVGAFGERPDDANDNDLGPTLYLAKHQITQGANEISFVVESMPDRAGVDPLNIMIDRQPIDNLKQVTLADGD